MKDNKCSCDCGPDEEKENAWMDACTPDELSCEDDDDCHWNGDIG